MDNYETRLYALAVRAPITGVHINEVEYPEELVVAQKEFIELGKLGAEIATFDLTLTEACDIEEEVDNFKSFFIKDFCLGEFVILPNYYNLIPKASLESYKTAAAAIKYAQNIIGTDMEQVVLTLPPNTQTSMSILEQQDPMRDIHSVIKNFNIEKVKLKEAIEEFKEARDKVLSSRDGKLHIDEGKVGHIITWNETTPATSIKWWICGSVLVSIILLILILCAD